MTTSNHVPAVNAIAPIYVLRLTRPSANKARILRSAIYDKANAKDILFQDIIDNKHQDFAKGSIILYIVGHAIPDGLFDETGKLLPEQVVAEAIKKVRDGDGKSTVIVWDVCYATSFLHIDDGASNDARKQWGANYVHVFACQDYELTLFRDDGTTQFSEQLVDAVDQLNRLKSNDWKWSDLEARLQEQFGTLQTPDIVWTEEAKGPPAPSAKDFGLYHFEI
jgi:hypothetical protein